MCADPRQWHGQRCAPGEGADFVAAESVAAESVAAESVAADPVVEVGAEVVEVVLSCSSGSLESPGPLPPWAELAEALRACTGAPRVLVVRFAAGEPFEPERPNDDAGGAADAAYAVAALARADLVSVAVVDQPLTGAGLAVALQCDIRLSSTQGAFCVSTQSLGGLGRLLDLVGRGRAVELTLTGRQLSAMEAVDIGLAAVAVPRAELELALADLIAALMSRPRDAAVELKAALTSSDMGLRPAQRATAELAALHRLAGVDDV